MLLPGVFGFVISIVSSRGGVVRELSRPGQFWANPEEDLAVSQWVFAENETAKYFCRNCPQSLRLALS
jgi:hypothetical protein